ncbi:MAG: S8 family serine peptidase [Planctomycetes bacterium]|nr:S8 family serine peptidase [Planctomycetota bacterium]
MIPELRAQALPGSTPGTEQWIVTLRSRSFDVGERLREIRAAPSSQVREQRLGELEQVAAQDQADLRSAVEALGGRWRRSFWVVNGCAIEIPPARLATLRAHPRVLGLWPNDAREPAGTWELAPAAGTGTCPPIGGSTDARNHNVAAAHLVPTAGGGPAPKGEGVTVAIFDTGLDSKIGLGTTPNPHPVWYAEPNQVVQQDTLLDPWNTRTRLWQSFIAGTIDCNSEGPTYYVHPFGSPCQSGSRSRHALHGTGVGSIAVGATTNATHAGHAPRSLVVGWSISKPEDAGHPEGSWETTPEICLEAVTRLQTWLLTDPLHERRIHVLNISFGGWPDPDHPVARALDALSCDPTTDILVVVAAGNEGDGTTGSHGSHNALSVGAVHKRTETEPSIYWPMVESSRGPLFGDRQRFYPDVCATGAGVLSYSPPPTYCPTWQQQQIVMAAIDSNQAGAFYNARGTSMAAPQVAGAAALYRARRQVHATDSALETKAAVLLNVDDPYARLTASYPETNYRSRNTYGVGYTRDDWLVEYAERAASIQPLAQQVALGGGTTVQSVPYTVRAGQRCAVVAAWFRPEFDASAPPTPLANVDLEILSGPTVLAVSKTPRNSYERAVFVADGPPNTTVPVTVRVTMTDSSYPYVLPVFVAGRELADQSSPGPLARAGQSVEIEQVPGCSGEGSTRAVQRTIPSTYSQAYGSYPFAFVEGGVAPWQPGNAQTRMPGFNLRRSQGTVLAIAAQYSSAVVGGDFDAVGIAFRGWQPFTGAAGSMIVHHCYMYEIPAISVPAPTIGTPPGGTGIQNSVHLISTSTSIAVESPPRSVDRWDSWNLVIPFGGLVYSYRGSSAAPQRALGVYLEIEVPAGAFPNGYEIDWLADSLADGYAANFAPGSSGAQLDGQAPVLGILEAVAPTTWPSGGGLPPRLGVVGAPRRSEDLVFVLQQGPPSGTFVLNLGALTDLPGFSGCRILVTPDLSIPGVFGPHGVAHHTVAGSSLAAPELLHLDLSWQVVVVSSGSGALSLSNAVITRFGGLLP